MYVIPEKDKDGKLKQISMPGRRAWLPDAGGNVPDGDMYWLRRIADGSVRMGEAPKSASAPDAGKK